MTVRNSFGLRVWHQEGAEKDQPEKGARSLFEKPLGLQL